MVVKIICDMCGKEARLFQTKIEETMLNVCKECSRFGKVVAPVKVEIKAKLRKKAVIEEEPEKNIVLVIVEDYAQRIKQARESLGVKQEDFAKKINEKESVIHKIETGHFEPSIGLAMKIEKALRIKLIEHYEEEHSKRSKIKEDTFTIGDLLKSK